MKTRLVLGIGTAVVLLMFVYQAHRSLQVPVVEHSARTVERQPAKPAVGSPSAGARSQSISVTIETAPPAPSNVASGPTAGLQGSISASPSAPAPVPSAGPTPVDPAAMTAIENLRSSIRDYGQRFGGNPIGTNAEITKALAGANPKRVKFLGNDGNRINESGELVDRWGTAYFFHQLSGTQMEIRSAGPDKTMWTADDLVMR